MRIGGQVLVPDDAIPILRQTTFAVCCNPVRRDHLAKDMSQGAASAPLASRHPLHRGEDGLWPANDLDHLGGGEVLPEPGQEPLVSWRLLHPHSCARRQPTIAELLCVRESEYGKGP